MHSALRTDTTPPGRRAFSLIELLVVIFIIVVVISLLVPALGHVRKTARKTETQALLNSISAASTQFENDNAQRSPGYFTPEEMGSQQNVTRGFTGMQNLMLDLAGGAMANQTASPSGPRQAAVGPSATNTVNVDFDLIGASTSNKQYFLPSAKTFKVVGSLLHAGSVPEHSTAYPEVVDAFGKPVLAWTINPASLQQVDLVTDFAREYSGAAGQPRARFYWASNTGSIEVQAAESMLGSSVTPADRVRNLTGFLGNPSSPLRIDAPATAAGMQTILPTASRGKILLQSAGLDGVFMGKNDPGTKKLGGGPIDFGLNFRDLTGAKLTPSIDIAEQYDDLIQGAGA